MHAAKSWVGRSVILLMTAWMTVGALARPTTYVCGPDLEVKVDFTPRKAQLHMREQDYTLQRVKSARDGHFVNSKAGIDLIANKADMLLREGKDELWCRIKVTP
jgi:hypothetical protein